MSNSHYIILNAYYTAAKSLIRDEWCSNFLSNT